MSEGINITDRLTPEEQQRFESLLVAQEFIEGQTVLHEGQPVPGLLLLRKGHVSIAKRDTGGLRQSLARLEAPAILGDLELVIDEPCTASVVAKVPVQASLLPADVFVRLLDEGDMVGTKLLRNIAKAVGRKLVETNEEYVDLAIWG